jgi:hypothetical protein
MNMERNTTAPRLKVYEPLTLKPDEDIAFGSLAMYLIDPTPENRLKDRIHRFW